MLPSRLFGSSGTDRFFITLVILLAVALSTRAFIHLSSENYNVSAEANGLYGVLNISEGKPLYPEHRVKPFHIYLYGPLHALVAGNFLRVIGAESLHARVVVTRALSALFLLLSLFLFWRYVAKPNGVLVAGAILALALGVSKFFDYAATTRNDTFSIFLEIAALVVLLAWKKREHTPTLLWFSLLCWLSFLTRQTSVIALGAATFWFLINRRYRPMFIVLSLFGVLSLSTYAIYAYSTGGAIFDHILLANMRGFRPIDRQFFDPSLISFFLSYILFVPLTGLGVATSRFREKGSLDQLLALMLFLNMGLAISTLFRAGGDVNYFFGAIFIGLYFCAKAIQTTLIPLLKNPLVKSVVALQILGVTAIYFAKAHSSTKSAYIPFARAADEVRDRVDPYVLFWGHHGASLSIHLRDYGLHGPDVTNTSEVSKNAHPSLRKILRELEEDVHTNRVQGVIFAQDKCGLRNHFGMDLPIDNKIFRKYKLKEIITPWLCLYRRDTSIARSENS